MSGFNPNGIDGENALAILAILAISPLSPISPCKNLHEKSEIVETLLDDIQLNERSYINPEKNFLATRARLLLETNKGGMSK